MCERVHELYNVTQPSVQVASVRAHRSCPAFRCSPDSCTIPREGCIFALDAACCRHSYQPPVCQPHGSTWYGTPSTLLQHVSGCTGAGFSLCHCMHAETVQCLGTQHVSCSWSCFLNNLAFVTLMIHVQHVHSLFLHLCEL